MTGARGLWLASRQLLLRRGPRRRYQHKASVPASIVVDAQCSRAHARTESVQVHPEQIFARKSAGELLRGWAVFKMFTYDSLVDNSLEVLKLA